MRSFRPLLLLVGCFVASPLSAHSHQKTLSGFSQSRKLELRLILPPSVSYVPKPRHGLVGHRMVHMPSLGPAAPNPNPEALLARDVPGVLPDLPSALVAVVEGGAAHAATSPVLAGGASLPVLAKASVISVRPLLSGPISLTAAGFDNADPSSRGLFLPFESGVGAAAFQHGDDILIVFDVARPFDLSLMQGDPLAAGSSIQLLPEATVLRLPGHQADGIMLRCVEGGWLIQLRGKGRIAEAVNPVMDGAMLKFPVESPGRVVVVPDTRTGGILLVGTIRNGSDAVLTSRHGSADIIEQTILGVVVDPLSDRLELRPVKDAFLLDGNGAEPLSLPSNQGADAGENHAGSRILSLAPGSSDVLHRRFTDAEANAAATPAEARFEPRLLAAEDALALGDAAQASAIAHVALADDPREARSVPSRLVLAAAALLEHHPEGAELPDGPQSAAHAEIGLWRAVRLAELDPASPEAAGLFAVNLPLLEAYPGPLRAILLPLAGEAMARGGTDAEAALLDHLPQDDLPLFIQALLAERRGRTQPALADLDRLSSDRDIHVADDAFEEAVAIREALPGADPGKLADLLETRLLDSRIAGHETATRFRLAELRMRASQWRQAFELLRQTASLYPELQPEVRRQIGLGLKRMAEASSLPGGGALLDQAAIIETNADMLPDGADGSGISLFLAARLSALDLPSRAAPIIQAMMQRLQPGNDKAELGLRLATLDLQENDLTGVQAALIASDPGNLPSDRVAPRLIVMARALAAAGKLEQALASILPLNSDMALELRATLLARQGDWAGASQILLAMAARDEPPDGKLDAPGQDLFLRLASAASRSGDRTRMEQVRSIGAGRFSDAGKAAIFRLLTSDAGGDGASLARTSSNLADPERTAAVVDPAAK